jgi:hypothetical protein
LRDAGAAAAGLSVGGDGAMLDGPMNVVLAGVTQSTWNFQKASDVVVLSASM